MSGESNSDTCTGNEYAREHAGHHDVTRKSDRGVTDFKRPTITNNAEELPKISL